MRLASALLDRVRGTRRANRARIAVIALVALVSAGLVLAGRFHPSELVPQSEVDRISEELDAAEPWQPHAEATDGGTVKVLEQGFALLPKTQNYTGPKYAVGFVLENTSRTDAVIPNIDFAVLDADGAAVTDIEATGGLENETIPPGGRIGVADTLYLNEPVAAKVSVSIGRSEWFSARPDIGAITATRVESHGANGLRVDVDSSYDTVLLAPTYYILYRESSGELLGGQALTAEVLSGSIPPGDSQHELELNHPPPKKGDPDATEVYVIHDRTAIAY